MQFCHEFVSVNSLFLIPFQIVSIALADLLRSFFSIEKSEIWEEFPYFYTAEVKFWVGVQALLYLKPVSFFKSHILGNVLEYTGNSI